MIYLFLDTETTGFSFIRDRIVSISWILADETHIISYGDYLINPKIPIPDSARRIHGISTANARQNGRSFRSVSRIFYLDLIRADKCVAHNAAFDIGMITHESRRNRVDYLGEIPIECTMRITGKRMKLSSWYEELFDHLPAIQHNSLWDSWVLMRAYFKWTHNIDSGNWRFPRRIIYNIDRLLPLVKCRIKPTECEIKCEHQLSNIYRFGPAFIIWRTLNAKKSGDSIEIFSPHSADSGQKSQIFADSGQKSQIFADSGQKSQIFADSGQIAFMASLLFSASRVKLS